ncbi:MAG: GNAT family N-acetyltransferase [Chloroflexi bacterium]|nr:GNAT family N-acetyltransferase [Chloroflexota bacterium]
MRIRPADLHDLSPCFNLDASYETDYVWQLELREDESGIAVQFRPTRLPRTMAVTYPPRGESLLAHWERGECVYVAAEGRDVKGYVEVVAQPDQGLAWVYNLIVDKPHRRQGLGTSLTSAAIQWAQARGLERLMVPVQSKNYPAICFCQKLGFEFCGFNDRYFANRDIALFFGRNLT